MNIFSKFWGFIKKVAGVSQTWYVRLGFGQYFDKYLPVAAELVAKFVAIHGNADFNVWYEEARTEFKKVTGETKDTWVGIVLHAAIEFFKGQQAPSSAREKV